MNPERSFTCNICGQAMTSRFSLKRHQKYRHQTSLKMKCDRCPAERSRPEDLASHMKAAHGVTMKASTLKPPQPQYQISDGLDCSFFKNMSPILDLGLQQFLSSSPVGAAETREMTQSTATIQTTQSTQTEETRDKRRHPFNETSPD